MVAGDHTSSRNLSRLRPVLRDMNRERKQASPLPSSTPPGYGLLGVLLLPIGLWWLVGARRRKEPGFDVEADRQDAAQPPKSSGG